MSKAVALADETFGESGPALVIVHGLFGSARNWRTHARELGKVAKVTVVDLRNHGQSPHADEMSYELMADDLAAFLATHGLEDAMLLGHSMGGKALMTLALRGGLRTRGLVIVDIAPVAYPPRFSKILAGLQALPVATLSSRAEADRLLTDAVPLPVMRTFLLTNLVRAGSGFCWRVNLPAIVAGMPAIEGFAAGDSSACEVPALFLRGERSNYVDDDGRLAIARLFPAATVETIANAGHWVHADQPMALIERVKQALDAE